MSTAPAKKLYALSFSFLWATDRLTDWTVQPAHLRFLLLARRFFFLSSSFRLSAAARRFFLSSPRHHKFTLKQMMEEVSLLQPKSVGRRISQNLDSLPISRVRILSTLADLGLLRGSNSRPPHSVS